MARKKTPKPNDAENYTAVSSVKLEAASAALRKKYGESVVTLIEGDINLESFRQQLPSGSLSLDILLGPAKRHPNGAWQHGFGNSRIIELFGGEASGKTTLALKLCANVQAAGRTAVYIDCEHAVDKPYAQTLGVDFSKLIFAQPGFGEEACDIIETMARTDAIDLIVVDSVAAMTPKAIIEGGWDETTVGAHARLMSKLCCKLANILGSDSRTTVLFINQIRNTIGGFGGNTTPGGKAMKFYPSWRIEMQRVGQIKTAENAPPIGQRVKMKVIKNKSAPPFRECEVPLYYGHGFHPPAELFELGLAYGLIRNSGAYYYLPGHEKAIQGMHSAIIQVATDSNLAYLLLDSLLTMHMASLGRNPDGTRIEGVEVTTPMLFSTFEPPAPDEGVASEAA